MADRDALLDAAREGDVARVRALVAGDPDLVNARDAKGPSAVLLAVYHGHRELADWLVEQGAQLTIYDAAAVGRLSRVAELLEATPELALMHGDDGFSVLGIAAFFGQPVIVDLLLAAGANPDAPSRNALQVTPLHSAVACRNDEAAVAMTEALLAKGARPNVAQQGGWTPLHAAAAHGRASIVATLLERGADPGAGNDDGRTPADLAAEKGFDDLAELLRKAAR